jgi:hypothetical protein
MGRDFKDNWLQYMQEIASKTTELMTATIDSFIQQSQYAMEMMLTQMDQMVEQEKTNLQGLLDEQLITQKQYDDKVNALEKDRAQKERALKRDQFQKEKQANIIKAIIQGVVAVVSAFASAGNPILGAIFAGITAALVATQIGLISKQPVPEFAVGGMINGPSHKQGGVPINAEGDEFIIRKEVVSKPGMIEKLTTINNTYATGGLVTNNNSNIGQLTPKQSNIGNYSTGGLVTNNNSNIGQLTPKQSNIGNYSTGGLVNTIKNYFNRKFSKGGLVTSNNTKNTYATGGLVTTNNGSVSTSNNIKNYSTGGMVPVTEWGGLLPLTTYSANYGDYGSSKNNYNSIKKYEVGGLVTPTSTSNSINNYTTSELNKEMLKQIVKEVVRGTSSIPVNVTEMDITKTQRKIGVIEKRSSW